MQPARVYDVLTQARKHLFDWVRPLSQEQYTKAFPYGMRSVRATMLEIAGAEWAYARRMQGLPVPAREDRPANETKMPMFADLEPFWNEQAARTRAMLASITDWDRVLEARAVLNGKPMIVSGSLGDFAGQLLFHEVHHRAQVMSMLRQLGVEAQNLDYGRFTLPWREVPA